MRTLEDIKAWLSAADKIIYIEPGGDVIDLLYEKELLCKASPLHHSGFVCRPVTEVDHIYYNHDKTAWQVFWKV